MVGGFGCAGSGPTASGISQHGVLADEGDELLGLALFGQLPETGARGAREDHGFQY